MDMDVDVPPAANANADAAIQEKLTEDGGLLKQIIQPASDPNGETPESGDEVEVHYTGRLLDGTVFDSSRDRNVPFKFTIGRGQVIKGWDKGIATMRKGEKAYLTCSADYAYGKAGSPPKIPADATLVFEVEMLDWKSHNDLTDDGGVIKKTLRQGSGTSSPQTGWEVKIHYNVSYNGNEVFSTFQSNQPISYTVGDDQFPKAFKKLITTMKVGDLARINCKAEYAYGSKGRDDIGIPPNADVVFQVELVEAIKTTDLLTDEPGKLVKRILKEGEGYKKPNESSKVHINLSVRVVGVETPFLRFSDNEPISIGQTKIPEAVELLLTSMLKGEVAEITFSAREFGFGTEENKQQGLDEHAVLHAHAELTSFDNGKESWEMNVEEKLAQGAVYKEQGNAAFKTQQYRRAIKNYKAAIEFFRYDSTLSEEDKKKGNELKLPCHLNLAASALKLNDLKAVKENCDKALAIDKTNVKALYRRAQAHHIERSYELAKKDLTQAAQLDSKNKEVRDLLAKVVDDIKKYDQIQKQKFSKLFASSSTKPVQDEK